MSATVSLTTIPNTYTTVNAEGYDSLWYVLNSASASLPNFTYVMDFFTKDQFYGTQQLYLGRFNFPPQPVTNNGIFSPAKLLRSVVEDEPVDFPVNLHGVIAVSASITRYTAKYGFQYNPGVTFSTFDAPFFGFLAISTLLPMVNGDEVILQFDNQKVNPQYNGPTVVVPFGSNTYITGNIFNTNATASQSGIITNVVTVPGTSSDLWSWNGTKQYDEAGDNMFPEFVLANSGTSNLLTDYQNQIFFGPGAPTFSMKPTYLGQYETIGFLSDPAFPIDAVDIITFDQAGNQLTNHAFALTMSYPYRKYEFGIGTQNLTETYGTSFTGAAYYEVIFYDSAHSNITRGAILRRIDYDCQYCWYDIYQLTWLNRRGSYEYYNFNKDSKRTVNIQRTEWKRELPVPYSLGDRGRSVLSQDIDINYVINSNFISQYDSAFLEELITSPEVYVVQQNASASRIPIMINDVSYTPQTYARDVLFNCVVSFKYAYNLNIQNQ